VKKTKAKEVNMN